MYVKSPVSESWSSYRDAWNHVTLGETQNYLTFLFKISIEKLSLKIFSYRSSFLAGKRYRSSFLLTVLDDNWANEKGWTGYTEVSKFLLDYHGQALMRTSEHEWDSTWNRILIKILFLTQENWTRGSFSTVVTSLWLLWTSRTQNKTKMLKKKSYKIKCSRKTRQNKRFQTF